MGKQDIMERMTGMGQEASASIRNRGALALRASGNGLNTLADAIPVSKEAWYRRPRNIVIAGMGTLATAAAAIKYGPPIFKKGMDIFTQKEQQGTSPVVPYEQGPEDKVIETPVPPGMPVNTEQLQTS